MTTFQSHAHSAYFISPQHFWADNILMKQANCHKHVCSTASNLDNWALFIIQAWLCWHLSTQNVTQCPKNRFPLRLEGCLDYLTNKSSLPQRASLFYQEERHTGNQQRVSIWPRHKLFGSHYNLVIGHRLLWSPPGQEIDVSNLRLSFYCSHKMVYKREIFWCPKNRVWENFWRLDEKILVSAWTSLFSLDYLFDEKITRFMTRKAVEISILEG